MNAAENGVRLEQVSKNLTICIPTYNRPEKFSRLIRQLIVPEITSFCEIVVADNASTELYDFSPLEGVEGVRLIRRLANIGTTGNFLRLFEDATTEWMMIIGDDDEIESGFAEILPATIENQPEDVVAVKFSSNLYAADDP